MLKIQGVLLGWFTVASTPARCKDTAFIFDLNADRSDRQRSAWGRETVRKARNQ